MSPYAKTKGSRVRMLGYLAEGECLRHFTTSRSKRALYRQPNKEISMDLGNVRIWSSCSMSIPVTGETKYKMNMEASECDLLIID